MIAITVVNIIGLAAAASCAKGLSRCPTVSESSAGLKLSLMAITDLFISLPGVARRNVSVAGLPGLPF